jgi:hypothetical protein
MNTKNEYIMQRLEEIRKAVESGRHVKISGIKVNKIEIERSKRGSVIVIINDGEIVDYASRIVFRKIEIV